jgi:hypothetical protein
LDRVIAKADGTSTLPPRSKEGLNKSARRHVDKAERQLAAELSSASFHEDTKNRPRKSG